MAASSSEAVEAYLESQNVKSLLNSIMSDLVSAKPPPEVVPIEFMSHTQTLVTTPTGHQLTNTPAAEMNALGLAIFRDPEPCRPP